MNPSKPTAMRMDLKFVLQISKRLRKTESINQEKASSNLLIMGHQIAFD